MSSDQSPKFSQKELKDCQSWLLPDINSPNLIHTAEREKMERQAAEEEDQAKSLNPEAGESIEEHEETVAPLTAEQLQAITESAEKEGYDNGYQQGLTIGTEEGKQQGLADAKETVAGQTQRLQQVIEALLIPLQIEHQSLQSTLVKMVCDLAKAVIQRELQLDSSNIVHLVEVALNCLPPSTDKFILYLNALDAELIESHLHGNSQCLDKQIIYHVDEQLLPGGCRLETKHSVVDYSVEQRIETIIEGFLHKRFVQEKGEETVIEDIHKDDHQAGQKSDITNTNDPIADDTD